MLTFVGFLAAYRDPSGLDPLTAGLIGATLTTWATFAPSILWIFLGAPHLERLRANRALSYALAAITAAVVEVILNLAVWFALHVLFLRVDNLRFGPFAPAWPDVATLDPAALALSLIAIALAFGLKAGMTTILAVCGALGLVWRLLL